MSASTLLPVLLLSTMSTLASAAAPEVGVLWTHRSPGCSGSPLAFSRLADGTIEYLPGCFEQRLYSLTAGGEPQGSVGILPANVSYTRPLVALDAFGDAFIRTETRLAGLPRAVFRRHDGRTGRPIWTNAALPYGPDHVVPLPSGDLLVGSATAFYRLKGGSGLPDWGPLSWPTGFVPSSVSVDPRGTVIVAGVADASEDLTEHGQPMVLAIDGSTGRLLWGPTAPPVPPGDRAALAPPLVTVDVSGDVVVAVGSAPAGGSRILISRLSGETGSALWGPVTLNVPLYQVPAFLLLDGHGSLFLCGQDSGIAQAGYVTTARYDAATGRRIWGPMVHPGQPGTVATSMALDGRGHLVVSADRAYGDGQLVTRADSAADGRPAWEWTSTGLYVPYANETGLSGKLLPTPEGPILIAGTDPSRSQGKVAILDGMTGAPVREWEVGSADRVISAPAIDSNEDVLLLGTSLTKLDGARGTESWTARGRFLGSRADPSGDILSLGQPGSDLVLEKRDGATGERLWGPVTVSSPARSFSTFLTDSRGDVVLATGAVLDKRSGTTGALLWSRSDLPRPGYETAITVLTNRDPIAVWSSDSGAVTMERFDALTGERKGTFAYDLGFPASLPVALPADAESRTVVIVARRPGGFVLFGVDATSGERLWVPRPRPARAATTSRSSPQARAAASCSLTTSAARTALAAGSRRSTALPGRCGGVPSPSEASG